MSPNLQVFAIDKSSKEIYFRTSVTRSDLTGKMWQKLSLQEDLSVIEREGRMSLAETSYSCDEDSDSVCDFHQNYLRDSSFTRSSSCSTTHSYTDDNVNVFPTQSESNKPLPDVSFIKNNSMQTKSDILETSIKQSELTTKVYEIESSSATDSFVDSTVHESPKVNCASELLETSALKCDSDLTGNVISSTLDDGAKSSSSDQQKSHLSSLNSEMGSNISHQLNQTSHTENDSKNHPKADIHSHHNSPALDLQIDSLEPPEFNKSHEVALPAEAVQSALDFVLSSEPYLSLHMDDAGKEDSIKKEMSFDSVQNGTSFESVKKSMSFESVKDSKEEEGGCLTAKSLSIDLPKRPPYYVPCQNSSPDPDAIIDFVTDLMSEDKEIDKEDELHTINVGNSSELFATSKAKEAEAIVLSSSDIHYHESSLLIKQGDVPVSLPLKATSSPSVFQRNLSEVSSQGAIKSMSERDSLNHSPIPLQQSHRCQSTGVESTCSDSSSLSGSVMPFYSIGLSQPRLAWKWLDVTSCLIEDPASVPWLAQYLQG